MHLAERHDARLATRVLHPAVPGARSLTAEDLWAIRRVGTPAPAPDGRAVVAPVTTYDMEQNRGRARLWIFPADGDPRPLTSDEATCADVSYSPEGRRLLFTRAQGEEKPQVHVLSLEGGESERLTDMPLGAFDPRWLPDGKRIVFGAFLHREAPTPEGTRELAERRAKDPVKAHVTEDRIYRFWDRWLTGGERPHLFVLDLASRALTDLTPNGTGWFDFMEPSGQYDVSPDGAEIAYGADSSEPPHHLLRWAVTTVATSGKEAPRCLTPAGTPAGYEADASRPRYAPDGSAIVYGAQKDPYFYADRIRLMRYDRATKTHAPLCESWDRSPAAWEFLPDGTLIVECEDEARVKLFALGRGDAAPRPIHERGTAAGLRAGRDGRVYFSVQTLSAPSDLFSCAGDGRDVKRLSDLNTEILSGIALGEVREMTFEGAGGDPVQMFVALPAGFDPGKKWPLVHVIHGGPHATAGDNFHYRWNPHLFAAPGYVVACVNFHGSTSWGQEFAACIQGGHGDKPYTDVMRATDVLVASGFVDEKRMAATGGSYGGYLVCWIAGQTGRFRCLVNHAGVFDLLAEYGSDVTQGRHQAYGGEPWDRLDAVDRWNPARFAKGFESPMLVIHGERDYRVPHNQALAVYNILKAKQVEARLVFFPDENHWILKPRNSIVWNREVREWLARHLA